MNAVICIVAIVASSQVPGSQEDWERSGPLEPHQLQLDVYRDRTGLPELLIGSGVNGVVLGTLLTRAVLSDSNSVYATGGSVLGMAAGILIPILATRDETIVAAQAAFYNFGQRWGLVNGLLIPMMWGGREDWHFAVSATAMTAAGVLGTSFAWPGLEPTPGQVSALGTFHSFSTISTSLLTLLFDVVPDNGAAFAVPVLLLSNACIGAAWVLRDDFDIDRRRVIWTDIGGYAGLALGLGAGLIVVGGSTHAHREQVLAASMLGGMTGGLVLGYFLTSGLDEFRRGSVAEDPTIALEFPSLRPQLSVHAPQRVVWIFDLVRGRW